MAPVLDEVTGSVGASAIAACGIDVSQLHWDMTSISLYGQYPVVEEDFARPRFGHPKDPSRPQADPGRDRYRRRRGGAGVLEALRRWRR